MGVTSVSFDDPSDDDLYVFSGHDLLTTHYDIADLDWQEVAERSALDERRGLVITQVAVLEDLIDEFITYLADPAEGEALQRELERKTIGPRLDRLEEELVRVDLLDEATGRLLQEVRRIVAVRNELAHGTIHVRPVQPVQPGSWVDGIPLEWVIVSRRKRMASRITMLGLRRDLEDAIGTFSALLNWAEWFVNHAPHPMHFTDGRYLAAPTP